MKSLIFYVIILVYLTNCKNVNKEDSITLYGETLFKYHLNDELVYLNKRIDSSGLLNETTFKLVQGDSIIQHGYAKTFFESEKLKYSINYDMGVPVGSAYFYYPNGKMETYKFFDWKGNPRISIDYDINGAKISGVGENELAASILFDFSTKDSIKMKILIPDIPRYKRNLRYFSNKCDLEINKDYLTTENYDFMSVPRDTCDLIFQLRFFDQDSLVYGEEIVLIDNAQSMPKQ